MTIRPYISTQRVLEALRNAYWNSPNAEGMASAALHLAGEPDAESIRKVATVIRPYLHGEMNFPNMAEEVRRVMIECLSSNPNRRDVAREIQQQERNVG